MLIAVYNGGAYLREAVDSVLSQTMTDLELILVDDASTDGAVDALPEDPRIRILRNPTNIGQIPSLNRGLREARAPYVARLDHDDVCLPARLERQLELIEPNPRVAIVGTWCDIVDDGRVWEQVQMRIASYVEYAANAVTYSLGLVHPTIMVRKDAVLAVGGFDERLGAAEDQELYRRLVLARYEARVVEEPLVLYRRHEAQMTWAKAAVVIENDARSYERFVAELAPDLPARTLQLLFVGDSAVWREPALPDDTLERFLRSASERLGLDREERVEFARILARRIEATVVSAWSAGLYGGRVRPAVAFVQRHGDSRTLRTLDPFLRLTAPLGGVIGRSRSALRGLLRSDALERPRDIVRRSRWLRRVYARLLRTSPPSG
jgi:GT2 family glycosyltransferase